MVQTLVHATHLAHEEHRAAAPPRAREARAERARSAPRGDQLTELGARALELVGKGWGAGIRRDVSSGSAAA
jgi:hypothetical protein